jgi:hypothetical protein
VLDSWNEIGPKLITMAEDFPEDKYDFEPTPAQRSFAEQLLHAAGANYFFTNAVMGQELSAGAMGDSQENICGVESVMRHYRRGMSEVTHDQGAEHLARLIDTKVPDLECWSVGDRFRQGELVEVVDKECVIALGVGTK